VNIILHEVDFRKVILLFFYITVKKFNNEQSDLITATRCAVENGKCGSRPGLQSGSFLRVAVGLPSPPGCILNQPSGQSGDLLM
jgi:hypothetical protein